jgi:hypothetical protein
MPGEAAHTAPGFSPFVLSKERTVSLGADLGVAPLRARARIGLEAETELASRELRRGLCFCEIAQERGGIFWRHSLAGTEFDRLLNSVPLDGHVENGRSVAWAEKGECLDQAEIA